MLTRDKYITLILAVFSGTSGKTAVMLFWMEGDICPFAPSSW
jgi:hypothetical protein